MLIDDSRKQYSFDENVLEMYVKQSPLIIRGMLFLFSFMLFAGPLTGFLLTLSEGEGIHVGLILGVGLAWLFGFFFLRLSLWNAYGSEKLQFNDSSLNYSADYKRFKDKIKTLDLKNAEYRIAHVGYEEDRKGTLIIKSGKDQISCATKMDIDELEEIIKLLEKRNTV